MPATRRTQSLELADQIKARILSEGLAEGDHFMTEAGLAQQYNVSRRVAREAVGQLRTLGVLRARRRKGLEVARPDPVELVAQAVRFYGRSEQDFRRLAQLRYMLEIGAVDLAVANATEEQVRRLGELADRLSALKPPNVDQDARYELECAFHRLILEATGHELVAGFHSIILDYFHVHRRKQIETGVDIDAALPEESWEHKAIARAFKRGDAETVRALLREHLRHDLNMDTTAP